MITVDKLTLYKSNYVTARNKAENCRDKYNRDFWQRHASLAYGLYREEEEKRGIGHKSVVLMDERETQQVPSIEEQETDSLVKRFVIGCLILGVLGFFWFCLSGCQTVRGMAHDVGDLCHYVETNIPVQDYTDAQGQGRRDHEAQGVAQGQG